MGSIFGWMNLRFALGLLAVLVTGITQMSGAQAATKVGAGPAMTANVSTAQQQPAERANLPDICVTSAEKAAQRTAHGPHTVTLSWHASVPASPRPADAISCYLIYRTLDSFDPKGAPIIGVTHAPDTTFVDLHAEPGHYHYAVRAVSVGVATSDFSKELPVEVTR